MQRCFYDIFIRGTLRHTILVVIFSATIVLPSLPAAAHQDVHSAVEKSSEKLFQEANNNFNKNNFWEAARDFIILLDFHSTYSRTDEVIFLLGECLYEIGLNNGAAKLYRHLLIKYIRSPLLPRAMLGLQRIEFDRKDFARCIEYHQVITRSHAPQTVMDASLYFAGLSYYSVRDYPHTIDLLKKISSKSPYHEYGQYIMALAHLRMKNVRRTIGILKDICKLTIESDERRNIIDESHLTLGYIYYELGFYPQAYQHLLIVSSHHDKYDDALLAAGWAAVKMQNHIQSITPLTTLASLFPEKETAEEGMFLLGSSYVALKMYDAALKIYDQLITMFPNRDVIPAIIEEVQSNLLDESIAVERMKTELLVLESNFLDALPLNPTDGVMPEHLKLERQLLIEARQTLMARIHEERKMFDELSYKMQQLQQMTLHRQTRKDWRAYAEYGKSRVLFLQTLE